MEKQINYATAANFNQINTEGFCHMFLMADENKKPAMLFATDTAEWIFPLTTGFQIHICNEFIRRLDVGLDIAFKTYHQYDELIINCGLLLEKQQSFNDANVDTESPEYLDAV